MIRGAPVAALLASLSIHALAGQSAPLVVEPSAVWGCADCDGPELFGEIQDLLVDDRGIVFVLDSFEPAVRRFAAGEPPAWFGREGQGPGEFSLAAFVGAVDESTLEIVDTRARRLTRIDHRGRSLGSRPMPEFPMAADYSATGGWYFAAIDWSTFGSTVKWLPDGADELVAAGPGDFPLDSEGKLEDFFPLAARPGGGYAIGDGQREYRIRVYGPDGEAIREIYRDIPRARMTEAELAAERERRDLATSRRGRMAAVEGGAPAPAPPIDPLKRHFYMGALEYDAAGRLWVLTGRGDELSSVFDLFDPDGAFLGELRLDGVVREFDVAGEWLVTGGVTGLAHPEVRLWRIGS